MKGELKPKFNVDEIVATKNHSNFNPAEDVVTIGKVIALHVYRIEGTIKYNIAGCAMLKKESEIWGCNNNELH